MTKEKLEGRAVKRETRVHIPHSPLTAPLVVYQAHNDTWELREDYEWHDEQRDVCVVVGRGFVFDLASIPRAIWWAIAPFELSIAAALIHDWLYRMGGHVEGYTYTRKETDDLFKVIMKAEKVSSWRWRLAYAAVRTFGKGAWRGR